MLIPKSSGFGRDYEGTVISDSAMNSAAEFIQLSVQEDQHHIIF
jgi:hypothetical protein